MRSLPRGRHGLPREFVAQNQRERLLVSIAESLHEHGYEKSTVSLITAHARVSKGDFYRHFANKDRCFVTAYEEGIRRLREAVVNGCAEREEWADRVCGGLAAALTFLARDPACANLLLVEGLRAGPEISERFQGAVQSFVPYLREGAPVPKVGSRSPEGIDEAVVGGIASLLGRRVLAGETASLDEDLPEIAEFALTPYLGIAEARRIVSAR